jgi:hypothetical protein
MNVETKEEPLMARMSYVWSPITDVPDGVDVAARTVSLSIFLIWSVKAATAASAGTETDAPDPPPVMLKLPPIVAMLLPVWEPTDAAFTQPVVVKDAVEPVAVWREGSLETGW